MGRKTRVSERCSGCCLHQLCRVVHRTGAADRLVYIAPTVGQCPFPAALTQLLYCMNLLSELVPGWRWTGDGLGTDWGQAGAGLEMGWARAGDALSAVRVQEAGSHGRPTSERILRPQPGLEVGNTNRDTMNVCRGRGLGSGQKGVIT